ncbi:hypothetical protein EL22_07345 [Halostagnicola sp. A56]|nr:hypothetical protein EL22_07345 [Halostagnicola sp. A56]
MDRYPNEPFCYSRKSAVSRVKRSVDSNSEGITPGRIDRVDRPSRSTIRSRDRIQRRYRARSGVLWEVMDRELRQRFRPFIRPESVVGGG